MKTINKRKNYVIVPVVLIILSVFCIGYFYGTDEQRLSDAEITAMRDKYPVCGIKEPAGVSMRKISLSELKGITESFVYGEVTGDMKTYSVALSTGNHSLDNKRKANGIDDVYEFYEYTIVVINDTEGRYKKGEHITIAANIMFKDYNPQLSDGMKIVVPVVMDSEKTERNYYTVNGMYYVTDDGYAISAFEETTAYSRNAMSGVKVEELLKELKK